MAATHDIGVYKDLMAVLGAAAIAVPLLQRAKINPVLGYLLAGVALGPQALGGQTASYPFLEWVSVSEPENLAPFAALGVTFLLFIIGLELSLQRLWTMRRLVFGLGSLQVLLSAGAIGLAAHALGAPASAAVLIGLSLALSSTAIVIELLAAQNRLALGTGRTSFAILLMQDLAVVPLLMLVPILAPGQANSLLFNLGIAFGQSLLAIGAIIAIGFVVLRPLFRLVASSESQDLFVAAVLLVAVGSGVLTAAAGLSMALGAFVAGLLLAETEYRRAIESTIEPVKGLLLGVFFFAVGANLDLSVLLSNPIALLLAVVALVVVKGLIAAGLVRLYGFGWPIAAKTGALIGPGGEFAFIVIGLAIASGVVDAATGAFVLAVTSLSMVLIPLLDAAARRIFPAKTAAPVDPALLALPAHDDTVVAIVVGHGRVGALVSAMLKIHNVRHIVTEKRADLVAEARAAGKPVYFGDAMMPQFLEHCGLKTAKAVIITIHDWQATDVIVAAARQTHPGVAIVARARDADHARHLYEIGVTDAVPETIEASLQLSEAALVDLGIPAGPVIASIHEKRDEFRHALQEAAQTAGRSTSRGRTLQIKCAWRGQDLTEAAALIASPFCLRPVDDVEVRQQDCHVAFGVVAKPRGVDAVTPATVKGGDIGGPYVFQHMETGAALLGAPHHALIEPALYQLIVFFHPLRGRFSCVTVEEAAGAGFDRVAQDFVRLHSAGLVGGAHGQRPAHSGVARERNPRKCDAALAHRALQDGEFDREFSCRHLLREGRVVRSDEGVGGDDVAAGDLEPAQVDDLEVDLDQSRAFPQQRVIGRCTKIR